MSDAAPKRRWFRFSLRTLFVVVTVVGLLCWVLIQLAWIRDRHDELSRLREDGVIVVAGPPPWTIHIFGREGVSQFQFRRFSGESDLSPIAIRLDDHLRERLKREFPEAKVEDVVIGPPPPSPPAE